MQLETFQIQIGRLQREWKYSFGDEKKKILWDRIHTQSDEFMIDAATEFIANRRSAPVLNDFLEFKEAHEKRKVFYRSQRDFDLRREMQKWVTASPNKAFAKRCMMLFDKKHAGTIPLPTFKSDCDLLDLEASEILRNCRTCNDGGIVYAFKNFHRYVFACACKYGNAQTNLQVFDSMIHAGFTLNGQ